MSETHRQRIKTFYDNTLYSRLDNKSEGAIVLIMQRLHEDDLVAHVKEQENWQELCIPAMAQDRTIYRTGEKEDDVYVREVGELIDPKREDQKVLNQLQRTLGSMAYSAQYQQQPIPAEGNAIKREWFRYYADRANDFDFFLVSWDTASTLHENSDWSVGTVWGLLRNEIYLLDIRRGKFEAPDLKRQIIDLHLHHNAHATIIEKTDTGRAIVQEMRLQSPIRPILWTVKYDKEARLLAQSPKIETGQVIFPTNANWLGGYLKEILAFPNGKHDDQVDSTSQALAYLTRKMERPEPLVSKQEKKRRPSTRRR